MVRSYYLSACPLLPIWVFLIIVGRPGIEFIANKIIAVQAQRWAEDIWRIDGGVLHSGPYNTTEPYS